MMEIAYDEFQEARGRVSRVLYTMTHAANLNLCPRLESHASRISSLVDGLSSRLTESEYVSLKAQMQVLSGNTYENAAISLNSPALMAPSESFLVG